MTETIIKIPTWNCSECGYVQDFDPNDAGLMSIHFPGHPVGDCPACLTGKNPKKIRKVTKLKRRSKSSNKTTVVIAGLDEVDTMDTYETDENGTPIREEVDGKSKRKMRLLNDEEKAKKIKEINEAVAYWTPREDK